VQLTLWYTALPLVGVMARWSSEGRETWCGRRSEME